MTTIRTVLKIAASKQWPLFQMDVNNAFLHGTLDEEVFMTLPHGHASQYKGQKKVCRLKKSLYGLKQASRQWFSKFTESIESFGFKQSLHDYSLFFFPNNSFISQTSQQTGMTKGQTDSHTHATTTKTTNLPSTPKHSNAGQTT
ncbi:unnamed protein product [Rhodiola kirilowii]